MSNAERPKEGKETLPTEESSKRVCQEMSLMQFLETEGLIMDGKVDLSAVPYVNQWKQQAILWNILEELCNERLQDGIPKKVGRPKKEPEDGNDKAA